MLLCLTTASKADIPAVVNIEINGSNHQVIELVEHRKSLFNREPETWKYKCLDSPYPLVIHKKEYEANKSMLKLVPDNRDFYTRHPKIQKIMFCANIGSLVLNILQVVHI